MGRCEGFSFAQWFSYFGILETIRVSLLYAIHYVVGNTNFFLLCESLEILVNFDLPPFLALLLLGNPLSILKEHERI